jgi:hypothetical protein
MSSQYRQVENQSIEVFPASLGSLPSDYGFHPETPHGHMPVALALTTVPNEAPLGVTTTENCLDCLVSGSSATPLLVLCLVLGDTACYFVFNPLDPITRTHLLQFSRNSVFPFLFCDGHSAMPYAATGDLFVRSLVRTEGRPAPAFADWVKYARSLAAALPGIFKSEVAEVTKVEHHRAYVLIPDEYLEHTHTVERLH